MQKYTFDFNAENQKEEKDTSPWLRPAGVLVLRLCQYHIVNASNTLKQLILHCWYTMMVFGLSTVLSGENRTVSLM